MTSASWDVRFVVPDHEVVAEATVDGGVGRVASAVRSWGDLSSLLCVCQHRDHGLDSPK